MGDGATGIPRSTSERIAFLFAVVLSISGQALQNISLPIALSSGADMGVVLTYTAFMFFCFFTLLDVIMDALMSPESVITLRMNNRGIGFVGFENALNGAGAVFGALSTRTPLTMQMAFYLVTNLLAPFYKMLRHKGPSNFVVIARYVGKGWTYYGVAAALYFSSMILVLIDKLNNGGGDGNALDAWCLFFVMGTLLGMMYNIDQDKVMLSTQTFINHSPSPAYHSDLTALQQFKRDVMVLRAQTTWLFIWSWIGTLLSVAGASTAPLTSDLFNQSWGMFLGFGNKWMNLFNFGYIVTFLGNIYLNRYDSSFTMIINNVSAVSSMWTGWVPSIMMQTVGFKPSIPLTVSSMALSLLGIYPSWKFSHAFKDGIENFDGQGAERTELIPSSNAENINQSGKRFDDNYS